MKFVGAKSFLDCAPWRQPFGRPVVTGLGAAAESETVLVEVCTGDGLVGVGETASVFAGAARQAARAEPASAALR